MSWHTGIVLIRGQDLSIDAIARALSVVPSEETASFEKATSLDAMDCFLANCGEWIVGANVMNWTFLLDDDVDYARSLARRLANAEFHSILVEGTSATYGYAYARDGHVVRETVASGGAIVADQGEVSSVERSVLDRGLVMEIDGEAFAFAILDELVGSLVALEALTMRAHVPP